MSALSPIPQDCVTQGNVTPAMRQWMLNSLIDAIGFDNAIIALQAARAPRNILANGDFSIWQRGTSFAPVSVLITADRWNATQFGSTSSTAVSRQTSSPPTGFGQYLRLQRSSGKTGTGKVAICQNLETVDSLPLAGQTVTLSVYLRAGADFSGSAAELVVQSGTGTDQNGCVSYTGAAFGSSNPDVTTDWTRFTLSYLVPATATELCAFVDWTPSGTAGSNDYLDIAGVQLELGTQATAFDIRSFGEQLMRCKRYFHKSFPYATTPATGATGVGATLYQTFRAGANATLTTENFPAVMRTTPTITYYGPVTATTNWRNTTLGADSAAAATGAVDTRRLVLQNNQVAGDAVGNIFTLHWTADAEM